MAILVPEILTQMVERAGRAADFYRSTESAYAANHHTSCRPTISSVSVQTVAVPVPQVMTQEVFSQVPVPVATR